MRSITVLCGLLLHTACVETPEDAKTVTDNPTASVRDYPAGTVRIIEPFGAGGGPDLLARALARQLSALWGRPVVVENVPGAGATAGPARVAAAPADGYTLLINTSAQAYSGAASQSLPYDPLRDFVPVLPLTRQPYVLVAGKSVRIGTVGELIAAAKAEPGGLTFGSAGLGTGTHLGAEEFNRMAGIEALHVPALPAESNADVIANAIAGRFTYYMAPISLAMPAISDGRLVPLGVTTARRSVLLPGVPTLAEAGLAGFDFPIWYGLWVRAGTSAGLVEKLGRDIARVLAGREMRDWIARHGGEPMHMTQPAFARFVLSESERAARTTEQGGRTSH